MSLKLSPYYYTIFQPNRVVFFFFGPNFYANRSPVSIPPPPPDFVKRPISITIDGMNPTQAKLIRHLLILLMLLTAFWLRLYRLDVQSLRGDEAATVLYAALPLTDLWNWPASPTPTRRCTTPCFTPGNGFLAMTPG